MSRILIGDFGAIASLGLQQLFNEMGFEVTVTGAGELTTEIAELLPDGVVVNVDTEDGEHVAQAVAAAFPAVTVVLCSAERPTMRVYPRFHHGESYLSSLTPESLAEALGS